MKRKRGDWIQFYGGPGGLVGYNVLAPGSYYEIRCFRCDARAQLLLPSPVDMALAWMKAFGRYHERCRQTMLGARWELIDALHRRKYALEHPGWP